MHKLTNNCCEYEDPDKVAYNSKYVSEREKEDAQ